MRRAVCVFALSFAACGDVNRTEVELQFADADLEASTVQVLMVVRDPAPSGDPCAALWGPPPSGLREGGWLIDFPNPIDVSVQRLPPGLYTAFAYALPVRLDRLCDGDAKCTDSAVGASCRALAGGQQACLPPTGSVSPLAGGCGGLLIPEGEVGSVALRLDPAP
jgi:hypothetical protein